MQRAWSRSFGSFAVSIVARVDLVAGTHRQVLDILFGPLANHRIARVSKFTGANHPPI